MGEARALRPPGGQAQRIVSGGPCSPQAVNVISVLKPVQKPVLRPVQQPALKPVRPRLSQCYSLC